MSEKRKKAYVFLDVGDVIEKGDEYFCAGRWFRVDDGARGNVLSDSQQLENWPIRRQVTVEAPK